MALKVNLENSSIRPLSAALESSEADAVVDRLAQKAFRHGEPLVDRPIGQAAVLEAPAHRRILLKDEFDLSFGENLLMEEMFKRGSCDQFVNLLSLFGVEIYNKIVELSPFLSVKDRDRFLSDFSSIFFDIHKHAEGKEEELVHKIADVKMRGSLFPSISSSRVALVLLKANLLSALGSNTKNQRLALKIKDPARRKKMEETIQREETQKALLTKKAGAVIELLIKIISHEKNHWIFRGIDHFEDAGKMEEADTKDRPKLLQHLEVYANFYAQIYDVFRPSKLLFNPKEKSPLGQLASFFDEMKKVPFTKERIRGMKRIIDILKSQMSIVLKQAQKDQEGDSKVGRELYYATLFAIEVEAASFLNLIAQIEAIVDYRMILPAFPDFCPISTIMQRCAINIRNCPSILPQNELILQPSNFLEKFQNYLCSLIVPIELAFDPLLQDMNALGLSGPNSLIQLADRRVCRDTKDWRRVLDVILRFPEEELKKIAMEANATSAQLMQFFQDHMPFFQSIEKAQIEKTIEEAQSIYLEKTVFIRRIIMLLWDGLRINKGFFVLEDLNYSPLNISDKIILDQLYELLSVAPLPEEEIEAAVFEPLDEDALDALLRPSSPSPELQAEEKAPDELIGAAAVLDEEKGAPRAVLPRVRLASAVASRSIYERKAKKAIGPKFYPPLDPKILEMTKTREIISLLQDAGFFVRGKGGPHIKMADRLGRIVPVPRHREQKIGTVHRMYELATAPIKRPSGKG